MSASKLTPSEANEQRLKDRWADLQQAVNNDELTHDQAIEMYIAMLINPRVIAPKDQ